MQKRTKLQAAILAAWALMPSASIAIEDCGTSVTECRIKQDIKNLQQQIDALLGQVKKQQATIDSQQGQIAELEKENRQLRSQDDIAAARAVCYSALTGNVTHSIILVRLPNSDADLDSVCHTRINNGWHAGGVAKSNSYYQNCDWTPSNLLYDGGYTSYVPEDYFEENRAKFSKCGPSNAFICCSPQFPN
jgi:TolA-binding protein